MQQFLRTVTFTTTELGPLAIPLMASAEQEYQSRTEGPPTTQGRRGQWPHQGLWCLRRLLVPLLASSSLSAEPG